MGRGVNMTVRMPVVVLMAEFLQEIKLSVLVVSIYLAIINPR